jgi:hypothetical protein
MDTITTILSWCKDNADILQTYCTIAAIIFGGIWTWILFIKNRQIYPRACITHNIYHKEIVDGKLLLRITIMVSNTGNVLLSLKSLETRIQQIVPPLSDFVEKIKQGKDPIKNGDTEIEWPLLTSRKTVFMKKAYEIEPGECQEIQCDFILDTTIDTISVYSYLKNEVKRNREIGWDSTTIYSFDKKGTKENGKQR